ISGSTQLATEEIDRMVADAQAHSDEDRKRREEIEARNSADSIAYQVERQLRDLGDRVPLNEKGRAEQLIGEVRALVKNNSADVARLRQLSGDLQQVAYGLASSGGQADAAGGESSGGPRTGGGDDVIDAEFKQT
ncbi:MAG TPA: Hsp70 family protein, partial [Burkholderiales bacterium]|nr:Hsp70 family protein [Burkholderiales bacterium]